MFDESNNDNDDDDREMILKKGNMAEWSKALVFYQLVEFLETVQIINFRHQSSGVGTQL